MLQSVDVNGVEVVPESVEVKSAFRGSKDVVQCIVHQVCEGFVEAVEVVPNF
jgi:hypothetical protein